MATYKVWLTVKDAYGNTKEIDGGNINIDLSVDTFSSEDIEQLGEALPFEDYLKKSNISDELADFATDLEVTEAVRNNTSIKYTDFKFTNDTPTEEESTDNVEQAEEEMDHD